MAKLSKAKVDATLATWDTLNTALMGVVNEDGLRQLIDAELAGKRRVKFVLRVHSRLNKVRAHRERRELLAEL